MPISNTIWWMRLRVDWTSGVCRNGKKMYACEHRNGCLIVHPCGAIQFISSTWYDDVNTDLL